MSQIPYVFNQLSRFIDRDYFENLVARYHGNQYVKEFSCWNHLLVMIWAQLTSRRSLRDIEVSLRAHGDKLHRMGIGKHISRNNISHANTKREVAIYRELAQRMMQKATCIRFRDPQLEELSCLFSISGFFAIDSSSIKFDLNRYPWSVPQQGVGGIKLHTMYDLLREVPKMCLITGHEERDQTFMEDYPYEKESLYIIDKAYMKTRGLFAIEKAKAFFIVPIKRNVKYLVLKDDTEHSNPIEVIADRTIEFTSRWAKAGYPKKLRIVTYYVEKKGKTMQFLTNNFKLPAEKVALLYKYRWNIEVFFKWIKQHLRINSFYGTSANAIMIQIYTAFTAYCILALVADAISYKGSLYDFANMISVSLTEKVYIKDLIDRYQEPNEEKEKSILPSLFDFDKMSH
mgnify:FL=1